MAPAHANRRGCLLIAGALSVAVACGVVAAGAKAAQPPGRPQPQARAKQEPQAGPKGPSIPPAPILVAPGPGGIMIASEDTQALDQFERLLTILSGVLASDEPEWTIFYLKHSKAAVVAETLDAIIAGKEASSVSITPEARINALIVHANPSDAETIEELLKVLDQEESPQEVLAQARPRILAVANASAEDIADVIRQVYQDRMTSGSGRGAGQSPGPFQGPFQGMPQGPLQGPFSGPAGAPQEFLQQMVMLGAGMGGRSGGQRGVADEPPKMSIGVVARTNSLVIAAPDSLFREVEDLVGQLDRAAIRSKDTVQVIALHGTDIGLLRQALSAMMGDRVRIGQAALAASRYGGAGVQPQRSPMPGAQGQIGVVPGEPRVAGLPQSPFGSQGMGVNPAGPGQTDSPQGPFSSPFPDGGPGPGGDRGPMIGDGLPGQTPGSPGAAPGGPGAGPGSSPGPGPPP
jgi:hypothetical protein